MKRDIDKLLLDKNEKNYDEKMCSFPDDSPANMHSLTEDSACRGRMLSTSGEFVEILCFRHFARYWSFSKKSQNSKKKHIMNDIEVSVVLHIV